MNKVRCADVTCSAVSCMSTGELHELVYAPHTLRRNPRRQLPRVLASTDPATRPTLPTTSTRRTHCRRLPTPPPRATANISTMPPASSRICSRTLVHADEDRDPRPWTLPWSASSPSTRTPLATVARQRQTPHPEAGAVMPALLAGPDRRREEQHLQRLGGLGGRAGQRLYPTGATTSSRATS